MNNAHTIRNANKADLNNLVDTLSDSFAEDAMFSWLFPSTQLYPYFFRMLVKGVYLPRGIIHIEEQGRAAALWLPPEQRQSFVLGYTGARFAMAGICGKGKNTCQSSPKSFAIVRL
tara:strand:- start:4372 stop:4719 length:348 start_codon:yes stop_codon:yes gene_type:complete